MTFTPEMRADEIMQRMWDEDVAGIADKNKSLTAEEVLAARKEAQSRRYPRVTSGLHPVGTYLIFM